MEVLPSFFPGSSHTVFGTGFPGASVVASIAAPLAQHPWAQLVEHRFQHPAPPALRRRIVRAAKGHKA